MTGTWWLWMVAGLVLAIIEVIIPGYIFAGFAVAAVLVGGLIWLGALGDSLPLALVVKTRSRPATSTVSRFNLLSLAPFMEGMGSHGVMVSMWTD